MTEGNPIYFIAEIGGNHEGSLNRAIDLIKLAAESGATAVKFQHYTPEDLVNLRNLKNSRRVFTT